MPLLEVGARTNGDGDRDGDGIGNAGDPMYTLQASKHHGVAAPLTAFSNPHSNAAGRRREDDENLVAFTNRGSETVAAERLRSDSHGALPMVAHSVTSKWAKGTGGPAGDETQNLVTHSLTAEGHDASEDGTGRGTPLAVSLRGREGGATAELSDIPSALRASQGGGDKAHVLTHVPDVAKIITQNYGKQPDNSDTAKGPNLIATQMVVRRLMPVECERLQGFPDSWTAYGADGAEMSDSARYRMCGNAVAVPVVAWLIERVAAALESQREDAAA